MVYPAWGLLGALLRRLITEDGIHSRCWYGLSSRSQTSSNYSLVCTYKFVFMLSSMD